MKKIAFIILAATLIVFGCSKSDDFPEENNENLQLKSADSRTVNFHFPSTQWYSPLYCGDNFIDNVISDGESLHSHAEVHLVDNIAKWAHVMVKGTVKSEATGEIFKINELNKLTFDENENYLSHTCRTHAKGNMGTNVVMFFTVVDFEAGEVILEKAICASNDKDE